MLWQHCYGIMKNNTKIYTFQYIRHSTYQLYNFILTLIFFPSYQKNNFLQLILHAFFIHEKTRTKYRNISIEKAIFIFQIILPFHSILDSQTEVWRQHFLLQQQTKTGIICSFPSSNFYYANKLPSFPNFWLCVRTSKRHSFNKSNYFYHNQQPEALNLLNYCHHHLLTYSSMAEHPKC